jgi:hypothetical protein
LLLAAGWVTQAIISNMNIVTPTQESLNDLEQRSFELFLENNKLITSLALLTFAAVGVFVQLQISGQAKEHLKSLPRWPIVGSMLLSALSLYFGFLTSENLSTLLRHDAFDLTENVISIPNNLQFFCFLAGVFCFGLFVLGALYSQE